MYTTTGVAYQEVILIYRLWKCSLAGATTNIQYFIIIDKTYALLCTGSTYERQTESPPQNNVKD